MEDFFLQKNSPFFSPGRLFLSKFFFACDRAGHVGFYETKIKFAIWWRHFSAQKVVENAIFILWQLKWRHQVAKFTVCFIQTALNFLLYHIQKIFNILGLVRNFY